MDRSLYVANSQVGWYRSGAFISCDAQPTVSDQREPIQAGVGDGAFDRPESRGEAGQPKAFALLGRGDRRRSFSGRRSGIRQTRVHPREIAQRWGGNLAVSDVAPADRNLSDDRSAGDRSPAGTLGQLEFFELGRQNQEVPASSTCAGDGALGPFGKAGESN